MSPWHHAHTLPRHKQLILIVRLDRIDAEVLVFDAKSGDLNSNFGVTRWCEVQAWIGLNELPFPSWLEAQMQKELAEGRETIRIAAGYRVQVGDLFGTFIDPDDVADGRV